MSKNFVHHRCGDYMHFSNVCSKCPFRRLKNLKQWDVGRDEQKMVHEAIVHAAQSLTGIKKSKIVLQLNYVKQVWYEELKNENRVYKNARSEMESKRSPSVFSGVNEKVAKKPLQQLFLQLQRKAKKYSQSNKETQDRVLSIWKLEQVSTQRNASELSLLL